MDSFVEKPSIELAEDYVASSDYCWNTGMFLFKLSSYLEELEKFLPDILRACKASVSEIEPDLDFLRIDKKKFEECPSDSVDFAVMEKLLMQW